MKRGERSQGLLNSRRKYSCCWKFFNPPREVVSGRGSQKFARGRSAGVPGTIRSPRSPDRYPHPQVARGWAGHNFPARSVVLDAGCPALLLLKS